MTGTREVLAAAAGAFLLFFGTGVVQQYTVSYLALDRGLSLTVAPMVLATVYVAMAVLSPWAGQAVRALGLRRALVLGAVSYATFPLGLLLLRSPAALFVNSVLWGYGAVLYWTAITARMLLSANGHPGATFGAVLTAGNVATSSGLAAWAWLLPRFGFAALFTFAGTSALAGTLVLIALPPRELPVVAGPSWSLFRSAWQRSRGALFTLNFVTYLAPGVVLGALGARIALRFSTQWVGWAAAAFYVCQGASPVLLGHLSDRFGRSRLLALGFAAGMPGVLLLIVGGRPALAVLAAGCLGVTAGTGPPVLSAWMSDLTPPPAVPAVQGMRHAWASLGTAFALWLGSRSARHPEFGLALVAALFAWSATVAVRMADHRARS